MSDKHGRYPRASTSGDSPVAASPAFPSIEKAVLAYWEGDGTFQASIDNRPPGENGENEFVFYDGPPFANGLPHYGHLLTGYVKDVVPRYFTMRGRRVERRFGWDTHGLPAELEAERQLGIKGRGEILELGIGTFNDACRASVLKYTDEWRAYVNRQARWVDFDNDYKTLNVSFMESVLWAFKSLFDKGLVYEGFRVLPYCWVDETPLSNHELRMDAEVYQQRQDPSVTVFVELDTGERLMVWTTTPWTLPSNLAVAVGPDIGYVAVPHEDGHTYLIAEARLAAYARELGEDAADRITARYRGSDLIGRGYTPLFDYLTDVERFGTGAAFRVLDGGDEVTTTDGTGAVHMASAYGEVDQQICESNGIPTVLTVDERARFTSVVPDFEGLQVFEANPKIIAWLRDHGQLVRSATYDHSYPHCWRCRNPLIYKAVSSWFVQVTAFRDRMVELNQEISWVPEHVKDGQFGTWLSNARDWSISRNRFWGSPIPVWVSDDPNHPRVEAYGSLAELEEAFGRLPMNPTTGEIDVHRPYIDELTRPNPDDPTGRSTMRRVPDVLDVWFDSGSMSFAQVHYPFENSAESASWPSPVRDTAAMRAGETGAWFEHHFPGDFIVEYIGQTRGWFYTLHILATALFDRPAFSSCISHGIVLGNDGQKMSKSLRNYPDVTEVFDRDGADAMRWFLMSSPILRGGNLVVTEQGIRDGVRQALLPMWNAWHFFALYANACHDGAGYRATWSTSSSTLLDRYLLAVTGRLVDEVAQAMDRYDIAGACDQVRGYVDTLTNWYVRRSRQRFWREDEEAFNTLYTALEVLCRVAAPLAPLVTEEIWRGLTGGRSVHLTDYPDADDLPRDDALVARMGTVRAVCSTALGLRKAEGLRVRLPLNALTVVVAGAADLAEYADLITSEVNVREVRLLDLADVGEADFGIERRLVVNARAAGPRLGKQVQAVIKAAKSGEWTQADDGSVSAGGVALVEGEYVVETVVAADETSAGSGGARVVGVLASGGFVVLDTEVTPELAAAGIANDLVRVVQQARREAGLAISDRIRLTVVGEQPVWEAAVHHQDLLVRETLADSVGASNDLDLLTPGEGVTEATVGSGLAVRVKVEKL
ncbi:MAG: isoleucine--tRNA ligase [Actinomycetales bacterium]